MNIREKITYEILEDGYIINNDGKPWIKQVEPYIPYRDMSYEECCLKQIEEIVESFENPTPTGEQPIDEVTELQLAIAELYEMVLGGNE